MSALNERLRAHIDALAASVALTEVIRPETARRSHARHERRGLTAVAAAALLLAGVVALITVANRPDDAPANPPDTSTQPTEQTTTTSGPTTTIDRAALNATWEFSGNWLIVEPGTDSTTSPVRGFVVFNVDVNGTRLASVGHGQCFLFSGQIVDTGDRITVAPIPDADQVDVTCDPGETPPTFDSTVACLKTGCRFSFNGDVIGLTDANAAPVADLVPATGDVPGPQPTTSTPSMTTTTTLVAAPTPRSTG